MDVESEVNISDYTIRPCAVDLSFENVGYDVQVKGKPKTILQGLTGHFKHGQLHCIMGPSGAGKSSLLNVLAGFNKIANGEVIVNATKLPANSCEKMMSSISSYIMQEDFLVVELTPRESLTYAARLKYPDSIEKQRVTEIVNDLLWKMALLEVGDRIISNLSGGQKKRVAVAVELLNYPPIVFLDEPTSGLDSNSCYRLIDFLKELATVGCNVIATIHQPNSRVFRMFDSLYVLAAGGRLAYHGAPLALTKSLKEIGVMCSSQENPADILFEHDHIAKLSKKRQFLPSHYFNDAEEEEVDSFKNRFHLTFRLCTFEGDDNLIKMSRKRQLEEKALEYTRRSLSGLPQLSGTELINYCCRGRANFFQQFGILLQRAFVQTRRDLVYFLGRIVAMVAVALVFGSTFQNVGKDASKTMINVGFLYLLSMLPIVGTSIVTMLHFPVTFHVLLREHVNSWYSLPAFYFARTIVDNLLSILAAVTGTVLMWLLSGQLQWVALGVPMTVLLAGSMASTTHHFAYVIAMGGDEESLPYMPFSLAMLQTLFGGFMVPMNALPRWIGWVKYVYYGQFTYRAFLRLAFLPLLPDDDPHGKEAFVLKCGGAGGDYNPLCALKTGEQVLEFVQIYPEDGTIWIDTAAVIGYAVLFFFLGWLFLSLKLRSSKKALARA